MKLSELIRDYIDLKIEGEPSDSEWCSIEQRSRNRSSYYEALDELEKAIDEFANAIDKTILKLK